jgi:hypothetical protein
LLRGLPVDLNTEHQFLAGIRCRTLGWMQWGFSCIRDCLLRRVKAIPDTPQKPFGTRPYCDGIKATFFVWAFALSGCFFPMGQALPDHSDGPARNTKNFHPTLAAGGYQKPCVVPPTDNDIEDQEDAERQRAHPAPPHDPPTQPPENRYHAGTILPSDQPPF